MDADPIIIGIINAAFAGIFSISAIIVAAYAIIARHVENVFLGMPVSRLKRFKVWLLIIPFILLLVDYFVLIYLSCNKTIFLILLGIFIIYICVYLFLILLPLYNKKKFNSKLTDIYIKKINSMDDDTFDLYLIEMIKSLNVRNFTSEIYIKIFSAYKQKINYDHSVTITHKIMIICEKLFLSDCNRFFVEINDLNISLENKIIYINMIYANFQSHNIINIEQFVSVSKDFLRLSLNDYLHNNDFNRIERNCLIFINNIRDHAGLNLFIMDIYRDDITELRYIEVIIQCILRIQQSGLDLGLDQEDNNFISQINGYLESEIDEINSQRANSFEVLRSLRNSRRSN